MSEVTSGIFLLGSDGDAKEDKNVVHGGFKITEIVWHTGVSVDCEVVGVCESVFLSGGKCEDNCVRVFELVARIKDGNMGLES